MVMDRVQGVVLGDGVVARSTVGAPDVSLGGAQPGAERL